jgi:hypothetical protein
VTAKTNGQSHKLRGSGYCLDCFIPGEVGDLRGRVERIEKDEVAEIRGRIERVARDVDSGASGLHIVTQRLEFLATALEGQLKVMAESIGRIGTRHAPRQSDGNT